MPLVQPMPVPRFQFFDANGDPVAGGKLYTYEAGTNTPLASYTDSTGTVVNANPVILDSGGFANVWLTSASYKLVLTDADDVQIWSVDGVPGLGSLISVGDLSPLFTSILSGGALNFTLDDVAPYQLFGRFAGTTGVPSYGAVGSDKQIVFNDAGDMRGSQDLEWDETNHQLTVFWNGGIQLRLTGTGSGGNIQWGSGGTDPSINFATNWYFTAPNGVPMFLGQRAEQENFALEATLGQGRLGTGSHFGSFGLNDGSSGAGIFAGPRIIAGTVADPNTNISAVTGSLFITSNGGAGATLWVKESSPTATTGWVAK